MRTFTKTMKSLALAVMVLATGPVSAAAEQRTAVLTAFAPEFQAIKARMTGLAERTERGAHYLFGTLGGKPVIVGQTGISMVNAAMNTQLLIDLFQPKSIVVSGIAGGVTPELRIGDVAVPAQWGQYLEAVFARENEDGSYTIPPFFSRDIPNYGMIFPQGVAVWRGELGKKRRVWFDVDAKMMQAANRAAGSVALLQCGAKANCLPHGPAIRTGGRGVSGQAFVDNNDFRNWVLDTFQADALDMESAAVATVAFANDTPFIAVRSMSDLAGGEVNANAMEVFFGVAAENAARTVEALVRELPEDR